MKIPKNNRPVIVGLFILVGLAILVVTVFTLGGQKKTFVRSFPLKAIFKDVGGLTVGANIWFSGLKIGTVHAIDFYGDSKVIVTMSIDNEAQEHIHADAKAKIGTDGFIGNKIVLIYGGDSTQPQVGKNDLLRVENILSTEDMMATLQVNNKNLVEITTTFKNITKKLDTGNGTIATLLNDKSMAVKLTKTIDNLDNTAKNFKDVSLSSKAILSDVAKFSDKITKRGNSINDLVSDTLMYHRIQKTVNKLEHTGNALSTFTENINQMSSQFTRKNNTIGILLNDTATGNSFKKTMKNLESGSQKLDDDLEAVQHNFLLKGFFKKKAKAESKANELKPVSE
jgi:phospholipid/cholesterol/gamma-HCH transport system substrate-binding protein